MTGLAAVSGGVLSGCAAKEGASTTTDDSGDQLYQGLCRGNCGGGCRIEVRVREGKVVSTGPIQEDNPLDFLICPRGLSHIERIYAPERIQYPVRRKEGTPRGGGEWERLTWDEAIAYICEKWKGYIAEYGNSSIAYCFCAGTYAQNYFMYMRLFTSLGSTNLHAENDSTMLGYGVKMFSRSLYLYGNSKEDEMNAKTIFIWGTNASIGTFNRWKYLMAARDKGTRLIVIDPNYTYAAQRANLWVPIKPGTDAALAMCMMKYWHDHGMGDTSYLRDMSVAPYLVRQDNRKFLRAEDAGIEVPEEMAAAAKSPIVVVDAEGNPGLLSEVAEPAIEGEFVVNGIAVKTAYTMLMDRCAEWTLSATSKKCDISEDMIVRLAELYVDGPTILHTGFGLDHRGSGDGASHALLTLPIVSGEIGKIGAGINGNMAGATTGFAGDNWRTVATSHYKPSVECAVENLPDIMKTGMWNDAPLTIKSVFFYTTNLLASYSGTSLIRAALDKVDLIVHAETFWNTTAKYSDVVLPVPHWFEYETYRCCPLPFIDFNDAAIPPQFESRPDTEIISLLGKGMGLDEPYHEFSFTNDQIHEMFLDTDTARSMGVTWQALKEKKRIRICPESYNYGSREIPWSTENGRAIFYFEDLTPTYHKSAKIDEELYSLPFQRNDNEAYEDNPLREKYPMNLITHRDKFKVHTAWAKNPWFLEIQPEPTVELNPVDAEKYGIKENDYVKCWNDRGFVVLRAHLDPAMRPGNCWTEHTWQDDQYVAGFYPDVTYLGSNDFIPTNVPFDTLVAIEVWKEA